MKNKQDLEFYYQACNEVAKMFTKQYFCDKYITDLDEWWVAGDIGGVICINDYFWNMEDMVEALKVGVNKKTIFEYYDWMVDENPLIENKSLHHFLNLKKLKLCKPEIPIEGVSNKKLSTDLKQFSNPLEDEKWDRIEKNGWPKLVKFLKHKK